MGAPRRRALLWLSKFASISFVAVVASTVTRGRWPAGAPLVVLIGYRALRVCLESAERAEDPGPPSRSGGAEVTYVVRLANEPDDLASDTVLAAAALGPTIAVIPADRLFPLSRLHDLGAQTIRSGDHGFQQRVHTDAAMILSAGAVPIPGGVANAASMLSEGTGWATGRVDSLSGVAADASTRLLRRRYRTLIRRAGGILWEPAATVLRQDLLPDVAPSQSVVLGDWLRNGARRGLHGVDTSGLLTRQIGSLDGVRFWSHEIQGDKGCAADLHHALRAGPLRAAPAEMHALLQELYAWPLVAWAVAPVAMVATGRFPLRIPAGVFWASVLLLGVLAWCASRVAHGIPLRPIREIGGAFTGGPGSLGAIFAACTGRLHPLRRVLPAQPLLVVAGGMTLATTVAFVDTQRAGSSLVIPVAVALAQLVVVWLFAAHSITHAVWSRRTVRLHPCWEAYLAAQPLSILDVSATGIAVTGDVGGFTVGDSVEITVVFVDRTAITVPATVMHRREHVDGVALGLSLELRPEQRGSWVRHLLQDLDASMGDQVVPHLPRTELDRATPRRWSAYLGLAALSCIIALGCASLALLGLGLRSAAVSSASMSPALSVGDLVIEQPVKATEVRPGDIVTIVTPAPTGSLTHRVRTVASTAKSLTLETRGDANTVSERFTLRRDAWVQKVRWRIPYVGHILSAVGSDIGRWGADVLACLLVVVMAVGRARRRPVASRSKRSGHSRAVQLILGWLPSFGSRKGPSAL